MFVMNAFVLFKKFFYSAFYLTSINICMYFLKKNNNYDLNIIHYRVSSKLMHLEKSKILKKNAL